MGCLSCFYKMTFLSITWQMMQTQHWNVSSCLCGLVCFHAETERAYNYYTFLVLNSDHVGEENPVWGNIYIPCHDISLHVLVTKFSQLDIATKCKLCYLHSYGVSCVQHEILPFHMENERAGKLKAYKSLDAYNYFTSGWVARYLLHP